MWPTGSSDPTVGHPDPHGQCAPTDTLCRAREAIDASRRVVEELGLLRRREAGRQALERVPQHRVAAARLVDREVRLEHTAVDTELLDREVIVVPGRVGQLLASRRARALVPAEAVDLHVDPAE